MYNIIQNTVIGTLKKSVYRDSSVGKLERSRLVRNMLIPHQQGFNRYCEACLPITVHYLTTFDAFKKGVVATMPPFSHSTAVATPFTGVVGVINVELGVFIEASAVNGCFKQEGWNPQNLFIESPAFRLESCEFLDGNISIVFNGQVCDVSYDFTYSVSDEVLFLSPESNEMLSGSVASPVCVTLQSLSPLKDSLTFNPNIFSEIELLENFPFRGENRDSEAFTVNINSKHIPAGSDFSFLGEVSNNLAIGGEPVGLTNPPALSQGVIPLKVSIMFDGNCYPLSRIHPKVYEGSAFGLECFAVSRDIEFDGNRLKVCAFASDYAAFNVAYYLAIEGGGFLAS